MQAKERKPAKQKNIPVGLSVKSSAAVLFVASIQWLIKAHGLMFFMIQQREKELHCKPLTEIMPLCSMEMLLKQGSLGMSNSVLLLRRRGYEWSLRWKCPYSEQDLKTHCLNQPSLPPVLFTFLVDMGITNSSTAFSVFGGLAPAMNLFERCSSNGSSSAVLSPAPLHPLTTICINAMDTINEVTEDSPFQLETAIKHVLSHHRAKRVYAMPGIEKEEDNDEKSSGSGGDKLDGTKDNKGSSSLLHTVRFFLLSPYAPCAALCNAANKEKESIELFIGGEACEVLLVYVCPNKPTSSLSSPPANDAPEVWGRVRYQRVEESDGAAPGSRAGVHDELFFIAETLEDYFRLGSAFSWVYGWQLCYAPQGPPPRSLPWLKLFSPSALSAAISTVL